jgi:hypothetical protein
VSVRNGSRFASFRFEGKIFFAKPAHPNPAIPNAASATFVGKVASSPVSVTLVSVRPPASRPAIGWCTFVQQPVGPLVRWDFPSLPGGFMPSGLVSMESNRILFTEAFLLEATELASSASNSIPV